MPPETFEGAGAALLREAPGAALTSEADAASDASSGPETDPPAEAAASAVSAVSVRDAVDAQPDADVTDMADVDREKKSVCAPLDRFLLRRCFSAASYKRRETYDGGSPSPRVYSEPESDEESESVFALLLECSASSLETGAPQCRSACACD